MPEHKIVGLGDEGFSYEGLDRASDLVGVDYVADGRRFVVDYQESFGPKINAHPPLQSSENAVVTLVRAASKRH